MDDVKVKINDTGMRKLEEAAHEMILELSNRIVIEAKSNCPVSTGKLKESIAIQADEVKEITVGTANTGYAIYVEMGTSDSAAQPFLRPALDSVILEGI